MLRNGFSASFKALRSAPTRLAINEPFLRPQLRTASPAFLSRPVRLAAARWYSDAQAAPAEGQGDKAEAEAEEQGGATDAVSKLKKALEAQENEAKEWKDKCLRTVADFRNLQDRTQREVKTARDFAIQKFAKDLVDSVDNLDRALTTVPADKLTTPDKNEDIQDLVNLHEGLKMTETILMQTLAKHGLERLDPQGEKFNPNEHEATFMAPRPDTENNTVFHVQQKGFKLNGRVLRAAKVGVVKNS